MKPVLGGGRDVNVHLRSWLYPHSPAQALACLSRTTSYGITCADIVPCAVGRSWQVLPRGTGEKPRWMGKGAGTPSNWEQESTSSCLADKINCLPADHEWPPCFSPLFRGVQGVRGLNEYFAHTGVCCVLLAGTHPRGKTGSVLLLFPWLGVHLQGVRAGTGKGFSRWQWGSLFAGRGWQHRRVYFLMKGVTWSVLSIC